MRNIRQSLRNPPLIIAIALAVCAVYSMLVASLSSSRDEVLIMSGCAIAFLVGFVLVVLPAFVSGVRDAFEAFRERRSQRDAA